MKYTDEYGLEVIELGWVPSPTFILRRAAILQEAKTWESGSILEIGCGSGAICYEFSRLGFDCTAVETSDDAFRVSKELLSNTKVEVSQTMPGDREQFDVIASFEVLEHIEDDVEALKTWLRHLKVGGVCFLSVPAGTDRWDSSDLAAGHFRRYDRADIHRLLDECGLDVVSVRTYGWPLTWFGQKLRRVATNSRLKKQVEVTGEIAPGDKALTAQSGVNRSLEMKLYPIYRSWLVRKLFTLIIWLQKPFMASDLGISFLIKAKKKVVDGS